MTGAIQQMKSANYLGSNLLSENSQLTFLDRNNIIQVVTAQPRQKSETTLATAKPQRTTTFLSFISSRFSREAQAEEKRELGHAFAQGLAR
jgi:hypothetical protein